MVDGYFTSCFYINGGIYTHDASYCNGPLDGKWVISLLPYFWRFLQCLRRYYDLYSTKFFYFLFSREMDHIYNALKYLSAILTTFLNLVTTYYPSTGATVVWTFSAIISSVYSYWWDIKKDWGLGDPKADSWMLRNNLIHSPLVYYFIMVSDAILRICWIVTISPASFGLNISPPFIALLFSALEVYRRFQWNIFRLENEFLNNCDKFRAVNVVPMNLPSIQGDDSIGKRTPAPLPKLDAQSVYDNKYDSALQTEEVYGSAAVPITIWNDEVPKIRKVTSRASLGASNAMNELVSITDRALKIDGDFYGLHSIEEEDINAFNYIQPEENEIDNFKGEDPEVTENDN